MTTVSLKLPEVLLREVEQEAATRGLAKSAIIRDCIERTLQKTKKPKRQASCLEAHGGLGGLVPRPAGPFHQPQLPDRSHRRQCPPPP